MLELAIQIKDLKKSYQDVFALKGLLEQRRLDKIFLNLLFE